MKTVKIIGYGLVLVTAMAGYGWANFSRAAPPAINERQTALPVIISDSTFLPQQWTVTEQVIGSGSSTVNQQLTGGNPGAFRFMSHRLPPVSGIGGNTIFVTHVYQGATYDPRVQGAIQAIDYEESGIILSFPFPEAFSTTQPVVVQDGQTYRSPKFIRFIAQNSSHSWETKSLFQLTAADFIAVGGSENDHPDFSANGGPIQFGFTRINSRTSTQPPVPSNQDMVIEQGVDNWRIAVNREASPNRPPQAVDDVFILSTVYGGEAWDFLGVIDNDSDPDGDSFLKVTAVTSPTYGLARSEILFVYYETDEARFIDTFHYTLSDGALTDSAQVNVIVDCACSLNCLQQLSIHAADNIDLPLIYRVRDQVLKPTLDGKRYVEMYYTNNPEILVNIMTNDALRTEAVATVELWQDNLRSLTEGDGSAIVTQAQVDAIKSFLNNLSAVSSTELQQLIADELDRLGPLDDYAGLTVKAAKTKAIGDPTLYLPLIVKGP